MLGDRGTRDGRSIFMNPVVLDGLLCDFATRGTELDMNSSMRNRIGLRIRLLESLGPA